MSAESSDAAVKAMLDGEDCRIEREDADIFDFASGTHRYYVGGRAWIRGDNGRWRKTDLWLVQNPDNPDHEETFAGVLRSFAAVLDHAAPEKLEAARAALAWVSGEGQRNCRYARSLAFTCCEELPESPHEWCDVCVTGAALYTLSVP